MGLKVLPDSVSVRVIMRQMLGNVQIYLVQNVNESRSRLLLLLDDVLLRLRDENLG